MMPMKDLCPYLLETPQGQILSLTRHKEIYGVQHEFLVMRIRAPGGRIVWLRLDRAAGQIQSGVRRFLSEFAAKDGVSFIHYLDMHHPVPAYILRFINAKIIQARVYGSEAQLKKDMAPNKVKARVFFDSPLTPPPTLPHLERLLTVISQESKIYTVWQVRANYIPLPHCLSLTLHVNLASWQHNCYFFASVIQENLTEQHRGRLDGTLDYKTLGQVLRDRIRARMEDSIGGYDWQPTASF